jgi:hypothetical protein
MGRNLLRDRRHIVCEGTDRSSFKGKQCSRIWKQAICASAYDLRCAPSPSLGSREDGLVIISGSDRTRLLVCPQVYLGRSAPALRDGSTRVV